MTWCLVKHRDNFALTFICITVTRLTRIPEVLNSNPGREPATLSDKFN
jgi:hypothetical protein